MAEGEEFRTKPFQFSTPRQERIYSRLRKVGPGPAAFYRDACRQMSEQPSYESTTHLVAHLLREIEAGLRQVLVTASNEVILKGEKDAHKRSILAILRELEIAVSNPVAETWMRFATEQDYGLARRAHRNALAAPRPLDEEFRRLWDQMELILDLVLEKFEEHYVIWIAKAEELAKKTKPTNSDAELLRTQLPNNEVVLRHFFAKLDDPDWLSPLIHEGFFEEPPAPIEDLENGKVRYSVWHQSRLLTRMAPLAPDQVLELVLNIPDTTNFLIHQDFAEASLKLPPALAAKLLPKIRRWLDVGRTTGQLNLKLGELLKILAEGGQCTAALELSHLLLDFVATPNSVGEPVIRFPTAQLDVWYYEQVLTKKFPSVVVEIGEPAFELLCDVLENAILLSRLPSRPRHPEDLSNIWCSSIEIDSGVHVDGKPLLVSSIRDAADLLANADPPSVSRLVKSLRKRRRLIFRRLAHHLLRLHPQSDMVDVERTLLSRGMLDPSRRSESEEYSMLMQDCFKLLSPEKQHKIVKWIDEGPNVARFIKRFETAHGHAPTDEQIQQVVQIWKKKRLDLISKDLSEALKSEFASLVAISTAHDETKTSPEGLGGAWMHSAPLKAKEIEALSIDEIVKFLNTWKSTGDWGFPTEEGLGATLSHIVAEQPERFAQGAPRFQGVRAIYVNAIVEGFQEAIRKDQRFDWPPLMELLKWAVQQQSNAPPQNGIADEWYWTRNSIARLISMGFESKKITIPFSSRTEVWKILEALCSAPPAIETTIGPENGEKFPNGPSVKPSVSPEPLLAAIRYAVWVKQNIEAQATEKPARNWFAEMPEFQRTLEDILSRNTDASVHSVFGEKLVPLADLDQPWLMQHLTDIFPEDPEKRALWNAAWNGFLAYWRPGARLLEILRNQYVRAIEHIGESNSKTKYGQSPGDLLADHLMGFYWWGTLRLDDDLMQRFLEKAPEKVRGRAMHQLGYAVYNDKQGIPPDTLDRVKDLFESRLSAAENATDKGFYRPELAAFSWCFASDKFDPNWKMNILLRVLRTTGRAEVPHLVVEELAKLSKTTPGECVECLSLLTAGLEDVFEIYGWEVQARTVLTEAISSGAPTTKAVAVATINRLASRGFTNFTDLV
jgi:hypothetical protein